MSKIEKFSKQVLLKAAEIIKNGGLVAFPTETVYGLGASALNARAVVRIFEVKNRPSFDPLIVHIQKREDLFRLCKAIDRRVELLIERFWPGPLTLVLFKTEIIPEVVCAGLESVAIRMPANKIALKLIEESGVPIAAPSANPFGYLSPTTAEHVREQIGDKIDFIIDGGKTEIGIESTVLDLTGEPTILRPGALPVEEIEKIIGPVKISSQVEKIKSPGQFWKHYAPKVPLKIIKNGNADFTRNKKIGLLAFKPWSDVSQFERVEVLSRNGDLAEAACNFFEALHRLEKAGLDLIYAEPVPEQGLGRAIMDRLRKAEGVKNG